MSVDPHTPLLRFPDDTGRSLADVILEAPENATIELAPGRYEGPLVVPRPIHLRGAGDLTRITTADAGSVLTIDGPDDAWIDVSSVLIEGGAGAIGAGIFVRGGRVRLHNVHVRNCRADKGGGAVGAIHGEVEATKLRAHDVTAAEGGAVWIGEDATMTLTDSQIEDTEAQLGGAVCVRGRARAMLLGVTIRKARALSSSGGQAFFIAGDTEGMPHVSLLRVRLEDAPLGLPLVVDAEYVPHVEVTECDAPRVLLDAPGVIDGGGNHWR